MQIYTDLYKSNYWHWSEIRINKEHCKSMRINPDQFWTRQLPMGAGYCQWGGLTDWNICNIYGDVYLASRYRMMLRLWDFYQFWHLASYTGNLPILGNPSGGGLQSFSNFCQVAKISWHAANGNPPDPPWSWLDAHLTSVTKIGPKNAYFWGFLTLTFDLDL